MVIFLFYETVVLMWTGVPQMSVVKKSWFL